MPTLSTQARGAVLHCGAEREESVRSAQQCSAAQQWLSLLSSSLSSPLPTRCTNVAPMLALCNYNSVLSQQHSARRVGEKERQQREQCVRPPFASLSSHSISCLSSPTSPPSALRHTPLCTTDDCPVCTVPRLPGEKERQQREQCVHSPLRLSFLSLSHSLSCFSSLPFRLLRQGTHRFT